MFGALQRFILCFTFLLLVVPNAKGASDFSVEGSPSSVAKKLEKKLRRAIRRKTRLLPKSSMGMNMARMTLGCVGDKTSCLAQIAGTRKARYYYHLRLLPTPGKVRAIFRRIDVRRRKLSKVVRYSFRRNAISQATSDLMSKMFGLSPAAKAKAEKKAAERKIRAEKKAAERKARAEKKAAERKARAEKKAKSKAVAKAKSKAVAKAKSKAVAKAKEASEVEAKAKAKAIAKAKEVSKAKANSEAIAKAKEASEAKAKAKSEAVAKAKEASEAKAKANSEAVAKVKEASEAKAKANSEVIAKAKEASEAKAKANSEAVAKVKEASKAEAIAKAKTETAAQAKVKSAIKMKAAAENKAKEKVVAKAKQEKASKVALATNMKELPEPKESEIALWKRPNFWGVIFAGVGLAAAGGTVFFGLDAQEKEKRVKELIKDSKSAKEISYKKQVIPLEEQGRSSALVANVFLGAAVASLTVAAVLFMLPSSNSEKEIEANLKQQPAQQAQANTQLYSTH